MNFKIIWFIIFCLNVYVHAQTVQGSIFSEENKSLNTSVLFKEQSNPDIIKEFVISKNGIFKKELKKEYKNLLIEVKVQGYLPQIRTIENVKKKKPYSFEFVMVKDTEFVLEEVTIIGKKKPYNVKEDTISYNVAHYSDGSERKIEDVIKKLPGVELNEQSGEIKYKGKSVEAVTLDGDNLFGFNYTLGTKNINVDMVDEIETIDNYANNPLLKGIEQGGKVSLNLKLKKGKIDLSGNLDYGSGWFKGGEQAFDISTNILGITKRFKSFGTFSYNNIGINHTPFDYFGFNFNVEQLREKDFFADKIIPETRFLNFIEDRRVNINNQLFGNYNAIFKVSPNLSIKTNLYYLQDKITSDQFYQNNFVINNQRIETTDQTFITKKPQQYRGDVEIKYNTSKTSLLEYNLRIRQENIETPSRVTQNENTEFTSMLNTDDFYLKQDLLWTKKLSDKKALQVSLFHSKNDIPQKLSLSPSVLSQAEGTIQESEFQKTFMEAKATYLGSGKKDKYTFTAGLNKNISPYVSHLFDSVNSFAQNNFDYTQSSWFNTGVYNFNRGNWAISPSYSIRFLNQRLNQKLENTVQSQRNFIVEPNLSIKYTLNTISSLTANWGYNRDTNAEQYFFLNQVLTNNRTIIKNIPSLELTNTQRYSLTYFNNDLYNQFQLNANVSYQKSSGNFFTNQNITENITQMEYFFLPQYNENWNMNMQISKYLPFIESTVKLTSNYTISNYKNIVNNSDLRQNQNQLLSNSFFWKTAFDIPINFENTFTYQYSNSQSESLQAFENKSWQNSSKIIVKPNKKWFLILSSDYYLPTTSQSDQQYLFLDATLRHRPKNKNWEASVNFRNLTNERNFERIQTSDISTNVFRSNLLPRYFTLNLNWNF